MSRFGQKRRPVQEEVWILIKKGRKLKFLQIGLGYNI